MENNVIFGASVKKKKELFACIWVFGAFFFFFFFFFKLGIDVYSHD